jgi:hypothetical protein
MQKRNQSGVISRKLVIWLAVPLILVGLVFGGWSALNYKYERVRAEWKTAALVRLAGISPANLEVSQELETLKASRATEKDQEWVGTRTLLMTNGEYIVYEYRHGRNDYFPPHLFLGRCSDGRWLYSSYHFCNGLLSVRRDDPPGSIAEFAERYFARAFDGKSDECLKITND